MTPRPKADRSSLNEAAPEEPSPWRPAAIFFPAATLVLAAAALLCVLRPFTLQYPAAGLDPSWIAVLGEAATLPARWGVDLTFTYGPASALVTRYFTDAYFASTVPILIGLGLVQGFCFACLARNAALGRLGALFLAILSVAAYGAAILANAGQDPDALFFSFVLVLFLLDLQRDRRNGLTRLAVVLGAAAMGLLALSKTSYGIAALLLFVLADVRSVAIRRLPVPTPVFLAAFLATFMAYGQRLADLPAFIRLQGEVVAGYGEAMYLAGDRRELVFFVGAAGALLIAVAVAAFRAPGPRFVRVFAPLGVAILLLISFKAGFVRQDTHPQISWTVLGLSGVSLAVALFLPRSVRFAAVVGAAALAVLWIVTPLFLLADSAQKRNAAALLETYAAWTEDVDQEAAAMGRFAGGPAGFVTAARAAKDGAWQRIRTDNPLPKLEGRVDILPSEQSAVLANGLDYRPRPSFQEYSTYTAGLIAANRAFYAGSLAPDWVLFDLGGLDDRYPALTEGALWPDLLRGYEPVENAGPHLALHRRTAPLPDILGATQSYRVKLGQPFAVPLVGPVFARIEVRKTILGRLAAAAFRPPGLSIRVKLRDGQDATYRFIPAVGAGGFMLSPMVDNPSDFAWLGFGAADELDSKEVTDLVIGGSSLAGWFYDRDVAIELQPVTVGHVEPSAAARPFYEELNRRRPWRRLVRSIGQARNLDGDRLSVPAPTTLAVPVDGARRVGLAFGIEEGAWKTGGTQGVCFSLKANEARADAIWRKCLDPRANEADRGTHTAQVDLPPATRTVMVETSCPQSCDWGWAYWNDIDPEK